MSNNKVVFGNEVIIDLTSDSVQADKLLAGYTAHDKRGEIISGTCTFDTDTSEATANPAEVLAGETFGANGAMQTGTMPNIGAVSGAISDLNIPYNPPMGFHDGSGTVAIADTEKAKIKPENIKNGVEILGVTGSYGGEAFDVQSKEVTPSIVGFTVLPDAGYDALSEVKVKPIPITETPNAAGGITVTIG